MERLETTSKRLERARRLCVVDLRRGVGEINRALGVVVVLGAGADYVGI